MTTPTLNLSLSLSDDTTSSKTVETGCVPCKLMANELGGRTLELASLERQLQVTTTLLREQTDQAGQRQKLRTMPFLARQKRIAEWYAPHLYQDQTVGPVNALGILRTFLFLVASNADVPDSPETPVDYEKLQQGLKLIREALTSPGGAQQAA